MLSQPPKNIVVVDIEVTDNDLIEFEDAELAATELATT